ncbi:HD-GYP domain-containing protein [Pelobacter seleniigenes]|uniref:HD-GYP domain-containing protein n=1 Tax=Pelobacter seleniigenes TaxID=407188 RepID=UPI0004A6C910|nr:HD domain-containing phosphohydrolase [Pelobacter seleniigenes]
MSQPLDRYSIENALQQMSSILATASLYSIEHNRVGLLLPRFQDTLYSLLHSQQELTFFSIKKDLLYDGKPLPGTPHTQRIASRLQSRNIEFISFRQGINHDEIILFFQVALGVAAVEDLDQQAPHIRYGLIDIQDNNDAPRPIARFEDLTPEELQSLEEFYASLSNKDECDIKETAQIVAGFVAAFQQQANPLLALVPLRMEDEYSFTHSLNVAILNIAQGMSLGLDEDLLRDVGVAGMLHDAGKIFIDKEIIRKPGQLTEEEWNRMRQHPSRGAQYLMSQDGIPKLAILTAFEHHMRYDQTGYPKMPKSWKTNVCSQMTMISDTFDALRTKRSYKEPWDLPKICGLLLDIAGTQLNPYLVMNFLKLLEKMGEDVLLSGISLSEGAPELPEEELANRQVCE